MKFEDVGPIIVFIAPPTSTTKPSLLLAIASSGSISAGVTFANDPGYSLNIDSNAMTVSLSVSYDNIFWLCLHQKFRKTVEVMVKIS